MNASPTWEEVLASFEQAACEAEALVTSHGARVVPVPEVPSYDPWQLAMPPLPEHLRGRAESVHARQKQLARELEASMLMLRRQEHIASAADEPACAVYVDRRA